MHYENAWSWQRALLIIRFGAFRHSESLPSNKKTKVPEKKKNQGFASVKSSKISSKASNWHASSKSCCAEIGVEVCHCNDYLFVLLLQMFCLASGKETLVCPLLCQAGKTQISLPRLFMCSNSFSFFCLLWPIYKTAEQWFKAAGLHITTENPHEL